ncbi:hypothetical protein L3Q82_026736 [Scortum barcoo]|uniref:Uncharacterized protein n=1 Tax=Scortum barcoo TaxID=214431 RepID=A0ACB8WJD7_9TELE|nr:hypothetical protein L3Q82_026736 [Scortum barcoo]
MFSASIVDVAVRKLWTRKVSGACQMPWRRQPRTRWWTPESKGCRQAEEGVLSDHVGLLGTLADAVDRYRQAKKSRSQPRRSWRQKLGSGRSSDEEEDYRSASKRFWQTVRRLRRGKQYSANTVYSAGGELLTSTGDIVGRWKKYFEDLLNPTDLPSNEEAEAGFISSCSGKAPGVDEIRPEYLKSLDVVGLSWLTRLLQHCMEVGDSASGVANWGGGPQPGYWRGEFGR